MRWGKWAGQGWMTLDERVWVGRLKVGIWARDPEKTLEQDKTWEISFLQIWLSMTILSTAAETAVSYLSCCCKHGGPFLFCKCVSFCPPWTIPCRQHPASPLTWLSARPWKMQHLMLLTVNWCTTCRSTLYGLCRATCQTTRPRLPSFSRQHQTSCLLCGGPLACGLSPLPALWRGAIFSSPQVPSLPPSAWALLLVRCSSTGYQHRE